MNTNKFNVTAAFLVMLTVGLSCYLFFVQKSNEAEEVNYAKTIGLSILLYKNEHMNELVPNYNQFHASVLSGSKYYLYPIKCTYNNGATWKTVGNSQVLIWGKYRIYGDGSVK